MRIVQGVPTAGIANTVSAIIVLAVMLGISVVCYVISYTVITYITLGIALLWITVMYALAYDYVRVKLSRKIR